MGLFQDGQCTHAGCTNPTLWPESYMCQQCFDKDKQWGENEQRRRQRLEIALQAEALHEETALPFEQCLQAVQHRN